MVSERLGFRGTALSYMSRPELYKYENLALKVQGVADLPSLINLLPYMVLQEFDHWYQRNSLIATR